jgi:hypothetical protein
MAKSKKITKQEVEKIETTIFVDSTAHTTVQESKAVAKVIVNNINDKKLYYLRIGTWSHKPIDVSFRDVASELRGVPNWLQVKENCYNLYVRFLKERYPIHFMNVLSLSR